LFRIMLQITSVPHAREGRANLPSAMCEKSHRKRNLTEKSGWSQGKISPASQSLGPDRAMFGSSRPPSVAARSQKETPMAAQTAIAAPQIKADSAQPAPDLAALKTRQQAAWSS